MNRPQFAEIVLIVRSAYLIAFDEDLGIAKAEREAFRIMQKPGTLPLYVREWVKENKDLPNNTIQWLLEHMGDYLNE